MSDKSLAVEQPVILVRDNSSAAPAKVGFVHLGCPKNLVDSEVMMGLLAQACAQLTARAEDADVIVVNTCSFIDRAQRESVNTILEMAKLKTEGSARKLVVAGCLVERYRDEIQKNIPEVDAVVGTGELEAILAAAGLTRTGHANNNSPFNILPQGTSPLAERAPSAVHQHSHPTEIGAQLQDQKNEVVILSAAKNLRISPEAAPTSSRPEG